MMPLGEDERLTVRCVCAQCIIYHCSFLTTHTRSSNAKQKKHDARTRFWSPCRACPTTTKGGKREGTTEGRRKSLCCVCVYGMGRTTLKKTGATCPRFRHSPFNSIDLNRSTHTPLLPGLHTHLLQGESAGSRVSHYASSTPVHPSAFHFPPSPPATKSSSKRTGGYSFPFFFARAVRFAAEIGQLMADESVLFCRSSSTGCRLCASLPPSPPCNAYAFNKRATIATTDQQTTNQPR